LFIVYGEITNDAVNFCFYVADYGVYFAVGGIVTIGVVTHDLDKVTSVRKADCQVANCKPQTSWFSYYMRRTYVAFFFISFSTD